MMSYDLLIKNARIIDGTGAPPRHGSIAITGEKIAAIGAIGGSARLVIDADGLVASPGFIDFHTHYDAQVTWDALCTPSCHHGVTTVLMGNCGYALAPVRAQDRDYMMGTFSAVEGVPKSTLLAGIPWEWETQPQLLDWLRRRGLGINVAAQVGHSAVRRYVIGPEAHQREATREEIDQMARLVRDGLAAGATGFTTTRVAHQRGEFGEPVPSFVASEEELFSLADVLREWRRGTLGINPKTKAIGFSREDMDQLSRLARATGRPVVWNEFSPRRERPEEWRTLVKFMEAAHADGQQVYAVARAQPQALRFRDVDFARLGASWSDLIRLPEAEQFEGLRNADLRERLAREMSEPANEGRVKRLEVRGAALAKNRPLEGRLLVDIAREQGATPAEAFLDLLAEERMQTWFMLRDPASAGVEDVYRMLSSPSVITGISDAGAHLDNRCPVDYPTYMLSWWVRAKERFTLEEAVRRMTSVPAGILGLSDRGVLREGAAADLCIFDPAAVAPGPETVRRDLPGGGPRLYKSALGIEWVIVNGQALLHKSEHTGLLPGKLVTA